MVLLMDQNPGIMIKNIFSGRKQGEARKGEGGQGQGKGTQARQGRSKSVNERQDASVKCDYSCSGEVLPVCGRDGQDVSIAGAAICVLIVNYSIATTVC